MDIKKERMAQVAVAGACSHLAQNNDESAAELVNYFMNDVMDDGIEFSEALEMLARAGIIVSLMAAKPDVKETFERITNELAMSDSQ